MWKIFRELEVCSRGGEDLGEVEKMRGRSMTKIHFIKICFKNFKYIYEVTLTLFFVKL